MSSSASLSRKGQVTIEIDTEREEKSKEAAKKLKREKMKAVVDKAVPFAQESSRDSVDVSVFVGSIAATAAAVAYVPAAAPFVAACAAGVAKEHETLYKASDALVQKTAVLVKASIDSSSC